MLIFLINIAKTIQCVLFISSSGRGNTIKVLVRPKANDSCSSISFGLIEAIMSKNYCVVLEFYKGEVFVTSECIEASALCDITSTFDIQDFDKCILSGYYFPNSDCDSDIVLNSRESDNDSYKGGDQQSNSSFEIEFLV